MLCHPYIQCCRVTTAIVGLLHNTVPVMERYVVSYSHCSVSQHINSHPEYYSEPLSVTAYVPPGNITGTAPDDVTHALPVS